MILICSIPDDIHFDHLIKTVPLRLLKCRFTLSLFVISKYFGGGGDDLKFFKFYIPNQTFKSFIYLYMFMG